MRIERLELFGYTRLSLSNIKHFVYTPSSAYQLILGTNGCGKSSILFELSPLPAHSSNYTKDGFKDITITHRGSHYRLISSFKTGKHNFIKDGEELNPGGTAQVQRELVRRDFNLTQELHEILIGEVRFTEMQPPERRKWITQLSTSDYTYPLSVHKKLSSATRDHLGTLRHLKNRLTQESGNLKALSALEGLDDKVHLLRDELTILLTARTPGLPRYLDLSSQMDQMLQRIDQHASQVLRLVQPQPSGFRYSSLGEVESDVNRINSEVTTTQALLDRYTSEYTDMENIVGSLANDGELNLENVDCHIAELDEEIGQLRSKLVEFKTLKDCSWIQQDTNEVVDRLMYVMNRLPDNQDRTFTQDKVKEATLQIRRHRETADTAATAISQIRNRLATIRSAKDNTCPKCKYVWREGYSEHEIAENERWLIDHQAILDAAQEAIQLQEEYLEKAGDYSGLYSQFRGLVNGYPRMQALWDHLLQNECMIKQPSSQMSVLMTWQMDVENTRRIEELQQRRDHLSELSIRQSQLGGTILFNQRMSKLNEEILATTQQLQTLRNRAKDVRQYRQKLEQIEVAVQQLEGVTQELVVMRDRLTDALRNKHIDEVATTHQNEITEAQHLLSERITVEGVVNDLTQSLGEVTLDHQALSLLAQALSPTEGLIAEQLTGFIQCLVAQMNSILLSVWAYDLTVLPCGMESGELDYKFPLQQLTPTGNHVSRDVSKGSKGQQEIVNIAFQLTTMLYMEMTDYPLFLDEPGEGFDERHRVNIMTFIKRLVDTSHYTQLFMVSHYAATHGSLVSAQVLVLDAANITVPGEYNQHVSLG